MSAEKDTKFAKFVEVAGKLGIYTDADNPNGSWYKRIMDTPAGQRVIDKVILRAEIKLEKLERE